ncbi:hypothetical protein [Desulfurobacterium sp.]
MLIINDGKKFHVLSGNFSVELECNVDIGEPQEDKLRECIKTDFKVNVKAIFEPNLDLDEENKDRNRKK